jgi:hypothetical protein
MHPRHHGEYEVVGRNRRFHGGYYVVYGLVKALVSIGGEDRGHGPNVGSVRREVVA